MSKSPLTIRVAFILTLALAALMLLLVDVVPPELATLTTMEVLKQRIVRHAQEKGKLPGRLSDAPQITGKSGATTDAWGHEISYSFDEDGIVTFTSLGRDGKPGGTGDASDITLRFRARDANGAWMDEPCKWLEHEPPR